MPRLSGLAAHLRRWDLAVVEVPGWQTRGSATFTPKVVIAHHTAGAATGDYPSLAVVRDGRAGLPGPLSQLGLGRSGRVYVIAAGRANHAGTGSWRGITGNTNALGIEAESVGTRDDWTPAQRATYPLLCAAVLDLIGRDAGWLCGHKEWTPRKIDPAYWSMPQLRAEAARWLASGPAKTPPPPSEEDDMKPYLAQAEGTPVFLIFPNGQAEAGVPTEAALADARRIYGDKIEQVSKDFLRLHGVAV